MTTTDPITQVAVQVYLPKNLVKELDHWCVDNELTRKEAITKMVQFWLLRESSK